MEILRNSELINVGGGAIKFGIGAAIIGGIVLLVGIVDGFLRPLACRR